MSRTGQVEVSSDLRIRILYEIAMSIGNSTQLEVSLKEAMTTFARKLDATLVAVFEQERYTPVKAIPSRGLLPIHYQLVESHVNVKDRKSVV